MTVGVRHDDLRRRNRALLIAAVRASRQVSRTDLAARTGLSHSTISAISADLLAEGVLTQLKGSGDGTATRRGRPQVALGLDPGAASVLTAVLSLGQISASLIDYAGNVAQEEHQRLPTPTMATADLVDALLVMLGRLIGEAESGRSVARIVLAIQGTTDAAARTMLWSPIAAGTDIPFAALIEDAFGIPTAVENDCNMIAVALRWKRPDRYREDFIALLLLHGIGMGMVLKGELFTGTQSSGGEFGHMVHRPDGARCRCGRRGCVEAYAGNYAIWRSAGLLPDDLMPEADIDDAAMAALAERARAKDGPERAAFRRAGEAIGFGLGSLFALIDPAPVAIVGHGGRAFDLIEPALHEAIARTAGGQHSKAISFEIEADEMPLIRGGAAIRALTHVDQAIAAAGQGSARA